MNTGKNGKESSQVKQSTKTQENCKIRSCLAQSMAPKDEVMDKMLMIRALSGAINEICQTPESDFMMMAIKLKEERKIKFRKYERVPGDENRLRSIDITIEI